MPVSNRRLESTHPRILELISKHCVEPEDKDCLGERAMRKKLREELPEALKADIPSESTIRRLINDLRRLRTRHQKVIESQFEWPRMEEYGLPWEASHYLLEMWVKVNEGEPGFDIGSTYNEGLTVRQAKWCWRVHLAAPDLEFKDTWQIAQDFVYEERHCDLLGQPSVIEDLAAFLAYGQWRSEEHRQRYHKASNEGRIPARKHRASGTVRIQTSAMVNVQGYRSS